MVENDEGVIFIHVKTKRLTDFKNRTIISTDIIYSYATFRSIIEMGMELLENTEFSKLTEKYVKEMTADVMSVKTNVHVSHE